MIFNLVAEIFLRHLAYIPLLRIVPNPLAILKLPLLLTSIWLTALPWISVSLI